MVEEDKLFNLSEENFISFTNELFEAINNDEETKKLILSMDFAEELDSTPPQYSVFVKQLKQEGLGELDGQIRPMNAITDDVVKRNEQIIIIKKKIVSLIESNQDLERTLPNDFTNYYLKSPHNMSNQAISQLAKWARVYIETKEKELDSRPKDN